MKKEKLKTLILTALIINSIFLTTQIWFDKKLWPEGYNFFHSLKDLPIISHLIEKYNSDKSLQVSSFEYLTLPYRMIVTGTNNTRAVYLQDAAEYAEINDIGLEIMDKLLTSDMPKYTTITRAEWEQALKGNSILMDYGTTMSMKLMLQLRSRLDSVLASLIGGFSEITIAPSESETNTAYIYIHDNQNGSYYRFTASCDKQKLKSMIDSLSGYQKQKYAFAFEMNLHKKDTNIVTPVDRMYLEPLVLLPLDKLEKQPVLQITNPFADNVNEEIYEQIVELFDLQPNNLRRSISSDGTVSYIENNATVEISPIGRIDYKAVDEKKGILAETLYDKLNLVWELAKKQYNLIVPNQPFNARIISELIEANQDILYIKMNYIYEGVPLIVDTHSGLSSVISAEFKNNQLINFSILVREIEKQNESSDFAYVLEALDSIYPLVSKDDVIDNVFTCYPINEREQITKSKITWAAMQKGNIFIAK